MLVIAGILATGVFLLARVILDRPVVFLTPTPTHLATASQTGTLMAPTASPQMTIAPLSTLEMATAAYLATMDAQSVAMVNLEATIESQQSEVTALNLRAEANATLVAYALDLQKEKESQGVNWVVITPLMAVVVSLISSLGTLYFTKRKDDREQEKHVNERRRQ